MIEMPNSQMILISQESSSMDSDMLITTTVMTTTTTAQSIKLNSTMPEDMMFNAGHQLSIIVYRFVCKLWWRFRHSLMKSPLKCYFQFSSELRCFSFKITRQIWILSIDFIKDRPLQKKILLFDNRFYSCLHSILMVISAIGNITVLVLLIKRRMRTPSRLDIMLTHLAIADLMVSFIDSVALNRDIGWDSTSKGCTSRVNAHSPIILYILRTKRPIEI